MRRTWRATLAAGLMAGGAAFGGEPGPAVTLRRAGQFEFTRVFSIGRPPQSPEELARLSPPKWVVEDRYRARARRPDLELFYLLPGAGDGSSPPRSAHLHVQAVEAEGPAPLLKLNIRGRQVQFAFNLPPGPYSAYAQRLLYGPRPRFQALSPTCWRRTMLGEPARDVEIARQSLAASCDDPALLDAFLLRGVEAPDGPRPGSVLSIDYDASAVAPAWLGEARSRVADFGAAWLPGAKHEPLRRLLDEAAALLVEGTESFAADVTGFENPKRIELTVLLKPKAGSPLEAALDELMPAGHSRFVGEEDPRSTLNVRFRGRLPEAARAWLRDRWPDAAALAGPTEWRDASQAVDLGPVREQFDSWARRHVEGLLVADLVDVALAWDGRQAQPLTALHAVREDDPGERAALEAAVAEVRGRFPDSTASVDDAFDGPGYVGQWGRDATFRRYPGAIVVRRDGRDFALADPPRDVTALDPDISDEPQFAAEIELGDLARRFPVEGISPAATRFWEASPPTGRLRATARRSEAGLRVRLSLDGPGFQSVLLAYLCHQSTAPDLMSSIVQLVNRHAPARKPAPRPSPAQAQSQVSPPATPKLLTDDVLKPDAPLDVYKLIGYQRDKDGRVILPPVVPGASPGGKK